MAESIKKFIIKDSHGGTKESGSFSVVGEVHVNLVPGYGEPYADSEYVNGILTITIHNIEGNGITEITTDSQEGDEAVNTVTIKTNANPEGVVLEVRNGSRGNGIASSSEVLSPDDGGTNTHTFTDDDGNEHVFHTKNGHKGAKGNQGDSAVYNPDDPDTPDFVMANTTGQSTTKAMTQKAVTKELDAINVTENEIDLDSVYSYFYFIYQNKWNDGVNRVFGKHLFVAPGQQYKVKAADDYITRVIFISTWISPFTNAAITPLGYVDIPAGETQIVTIPAGAYHIYIQDNTQGTTTNMQLPDYFALVVSDSIRETLDWTINPSVKKAISDKEILAKYDYKDCTRDYSMLVDGNNSSVSTKGNGFFSSEFIPIPQGTTNIIYNGVQTIYKIFKSYGTFELCGLVITDANHVVQWYNESGNGEVDLADYPNAAYIRFCPALRNLTSTVEMAKRGGYQNIEFSVNGEDIVKQYGCTIEGNAYSASSVVKHLASDMPCVEDGIIGTVSALLNDGECTLYIGSIDQNGYLVIRDSFSFNSVGYGNGWTTVDVSNRNIRMMKGEYLFSSNYGAKVAFGVMDGSPSAFTVQQDNMRHDFPEGTNVILSLVYTVKGRKLSQSEMSEELESVKTDVAENTVEIANIKANKKYFVEDEVTHENYQIIVRNGQLSLRKAQYSKAAVLGNSITTHDITDIWWGEWGMAATKREYDMVHIIQEGLQAKDPNAEVLPVQMAPWERDFTLDLSTIIGDNITAETDLVIIRLGTNVPADNVSGLEAALENLIDYVMSVATNAKVVITGQFYPSADRETACQTAAATKGIDYIRIDQFGITAYKEEVGHYVYGDDDAIHAINNSGAANHPSNKGMLAIANTILNAIGYDPVVKSYSLQEVTVGGVTGMMYVEDEQ